MTVINLPAWLKSYAPDATAPLWLSEYREKHWHAFAKQGLPTPKQERWKYADLYSLAQQTFRDAEPLDDRQYQEVVQPYRDTHADSVFLVFIDGFLSWGLSDLSLLPKKVIISNLVDAIHQHAHLFAQHWACHADNAFASLNAAQFIDGLFLYVPDAVNIETPIYCLSLTAGDNVLIQPKRFFIVGKQSKLTLIDEHIATTDTPYLLNLATTIVLDQAAQVEHYKIQNEHQSASHFANTFIEQHQDSHYTGTYFSLGAHFARDEVQVTLQKPGAICSTAGLYRLTQADQYIDFHIDIDHGAAHSQSEMLFKGVLDKKSRAVFNGRLHVIPASQKITAYQANHNLLLSNAAEVYTKPELEIYADDVKCKHGATVGQLDQDALFYLRSRGISHAEAVAILLKGFSDEITQRVRQTNLRARIETMVAS